MTRPGMFGILLTMAVLGRGAGACEMHQMMGQPEPVGIWPTAPFSNTTTEVKAMALGPTTNALAGQAVAAATAITDPSITGWMLNTTGRKGTSTNATINNAVRLIDADVQTVAYSSTHVYVKTNGIPSHNVGPFPGNPNTPSAQNRTVRISRTPQANPGTKTNTGLGNIAVGVNGVAIFNPLDAFSYQNQGVWRQNANVFEAASFDAAKGHPQQQGNYHYHQRPTALIEQLDPGNTGQKHSPIIGFAFDGFPIYGPYGFANADGTGGVERMETGYRTRNITVRNTLANGQSVLPGPTVASVALGSYVEDYEYIAGLGDLDQYNGRFAVTPEYPEGTYAYFATIDAAGAPVYPYLIGPQYYGVVDTGNLQGGTIVVPADVESYTVPEPGVGMIAAGLVLFAGLRRRDNRSAVRL